MDRLEPSKAMVIRLSLRGFSKAIVHLKQEDPTGL
jgi:hypothetical protein